MFLRSTTRLKDGKKHSYWSIVENRRCRADRVVQQTVLYLGEINDSEREQWIRAIEVFDEDAGAVEQLKLFAAERRLLATAPDRVEVRLKDFELHRPRQWGGCWLFSELWQRGNNCNSMSSGEFDWVAVAKAPIGSTCFRLWSATGYWIRAVSGAFIEYGLNNQRWAICLQKTSRL